MARYLLLDLDEEDDSEDDDHDGHQHDDGDVKGWSVCNPVGVRKPGGCHFYQKGFDFLTVT